MNTATGFSDPLVSDTPLPFHELCARIHDRIAAFLDAKDVPERVKSVQEQTRVALGVIEEALARYRSVTGSVHHGNCEADGDLKLAGAFISI
jgi:FAD synthetase